MLQTLQFDVAAEKGVVCAAAAEESDGFAIAVGEWGKAAAAACVSSLRGESKMLGLVGWVGAIVGAYGNMFSSNMTCLEMMIRRLMRSRQR